LGFNDRLTRRALAAEDFHTLGFGIRNGLQAAPFPERKKPSSISMRRACSLCRERNVEILHQLGNLPAWMLEECKYEANLDLREKGHSRNLSNLIRNRRAALMPLLFAAMLCFLAVYVFTSTFYCADSHHARSRCHDFAVRRQ